MKIDELHSGVLADLKLLFPAVERNIDKHSGRFDIEELDALSANAPALFVSFLDIKGVEEAGDGRTDLTCLFAIYLVTTDKRGLQRDAAAKNMMEAITAWLPNKRFGVGGVGVPENIRANTLYNGKARSRKVALCAVQWDQKVRTGTSIFKEDGTVPIEVYTRFGDDEEQVVSGAD